MDEENEHSYLYKKIDSIEHRLESHVTKIEQRLDQLVSIMGAVASLQERETRNADSIREIKSSIRDSFDKFEKAVERIHGRLDSINKNMDGAVYNYTDSHKKLETRIIEVDGEVAKWRERGVGLWLGVSMLVIALQLMGGYILKNFSEEYTITKAHVAEISKKQLEHEQELTRLKKALAVNHPSYP